MGYIIYHIYHVISYHIMIWHRTQKLLFFSTFFENSGDHFFDLKSLSIVLPVRVPEFFEVTFDRFFSGSPKRSKMAKYDQKGSKKNQKKKNLRSLSGSLSELFDISLTTVWAHFSNEFS